jgi:hypothetical protein
VGWRGRKTHTKAKASDQRKDATTPNRNHRDVNGPVIGADLCAQIVHISIGKKKEQTEMRPSKIGHGPVAVMYPDSLLPKLKFVQEKIIARKGNYPAK